METDNHPFNNPFNNKLFTMVLNMQEIAGDELVKVLQIKKKIPRRKALSSLEEKVLSILTEIGYVSKDEAFGASERIPDMLDDEDEDEEVVVDGEVDEGDVHIKPVTRKPTPLVNFNFLSSRDCTKM